MKMTQSSQDNHSGKLASDMVVGMIVAVAFAVAAIVSNLMNPMPALKKVGSVDTVPSLTFAYLVDSRLDIVVVNMDLDSTVLQVCLVKSNISMYFHILLDNLSYYHMVLGIMKG